MTGSSVYDPGEEFLLKFGIENTTDDNKFAFHIIGLPPLHINSDLNGTIEAYITAVVGPDRLFLSQTLANITRISTALELDPPKPLPPQHIERFAMVRLPDYKGTMTWMRALVIERTETFAELFTIDIGNIYAVPLNSLYKMSRYYVPIALRFTNMTEYFFLRDFKKLLWAKVNVKIYSYDNVSFLSDTLEMRSSTDEQFDLSSARNALLKE
ncbi:unnamed protein product [Cylicocyclus nassatus]|uniref:Uncharacterized protein n=1 Tax=Cylicocyclus nassatus TaxID=53992 RepID=A0AA36M6S4_CYLNA|nr:unnamed protein product [Cylicocyclus nassatus]